MSVTELEVVAPEISPEVKADPMALWPTREAFLDWCREHAIQGTTGNGYNCLIARALKRVSGRNFAVTKVDYAEYNPLSGMHDQGRTPLPAHLKRIVEDFDCHRLEEFDEECDAGK